MLSSSPDQSGTDGTALRMAAVVAEARGNRLDDVAVYGRRGMIGRRSDTESVSGWSGPVDRWEHTVLFGGQVSAWNLSIGPKAVILLPAGATDRKRVMQQPWGLYSMEDLLRLA
jgi:4-hydroxy-tetrahydrodipicolinate reductase